jgi:hypothetical protein
MINQVNNGDSGLTVRTAINQTIDKVNYSGVQLLGSASVNLNLPDVPLPYYILSSGAAVTSGKDQLALNYSNTKLTYTGATGPFTLHETVTDDNGSTGTIFYNSASTMSLAYISPNNQNISPFTFGIGFTGSISGNTATIATSVSGSLLTPGESIISLDSSSATVVSSQTGSYTYGDNSEITSVVGNFTVGLLSTSGIDMNPWILGETINDTTSGASATLIYRNDAGTFVVKNITGSFSTGDTIVGSLSENSNTLSGDLQVSYSGNVAVGQTSKVAFPINNLFTTSHADQTITLSGGDKFVVTDMLMTNGVGTYVTASAGPYLFTSQSQNGNLIAIGTPEVTSDNQLANPSQGVIKVLLASPSNYVNNIGYLNNSNILTDGIITPIYAYPTGIMLLSQVTVGSTLYYSNVPNTSAATADVYVYGYILS